MYDIDFIKLKKLLRDEIIADLKNEYDSEQDTIIKDENVQEQANKHINYNALKQKQCQGQSAGNKADETVKAKVKTKVKAKAKTKSETKADSKSVLKTDGKVKTCKDDSKPGDDSKGPKYYFTIT
ncbi:MAG TPA: hypothetical protein GXX49_04930 [Clostridiaceae bacterium]|nr:hypothetical protein [Clostridiaceae bacterium]